MATRERKKRIYRKRIPYGMQNFEDVIKEDCYYVDKTPFIEDIEAANKYFFYIRPRRFGKSLTISMLENYYDIKKKDEFESLFGKLYIGEHPTPERNSYLILHFNFATTFSHCFFIYSLPYLRFFSLLLINHSFLFLTFSL